MNVDYPLDSAPATPEYVLEVFRDWHRHAAAWGEADPTAVLTAEISLTDWQDAMEIESWGKGGFGGGMNEAWEIRVPAAEWQAFLAPSGRTLGDLCRFLAARVRRSVARPWRHVSGECLPAGVFLTIRSTLAAAGADPGRVTPSSPLDPFLTSQFHKVWWQWSKLWPGRGPVCERAHPNGVGRLIRVCGLSGLLLIGVGLLLGWIGAAGREVGAVGVGLLAAGIILDQATGFSRFVPEHLRTFRDLSYALAGQQPRRRIQPTT